MIEELVNIIEVFLVGIGLILSSLAIRQPELGLYHETPLLIGAHML